MLRAFIFALIAVLPLLAQARINPGDVNGDLSLDIQDVTLLINHILGKPVEVAVPEAGDVYTDGNVDIMDVTQLINLILRGAQAYPDIVVPEGSVPYTVGDVIFYMVLVEGGTFMMGEPGGGKNQLHQVTLSSYSIGLTEVTYALWYAVMGSYTGNHIAENQAVQGVDRDDCRYFIERLNQITGMNFRLPTEAQWEFAAKGGNLSNGYTYAGSNNVEEVAWNEDNSYITWFVPGFADRCIEVGMKRPNELGLYDMSGNAEEWILDCGTSGRLLDYPSQPQVDPLVGNGEMGHGVGILRSGLPVTNRLYINTAVSTQYSGLRLAL